MLGIFQGIFLLGAGIIFGALLVLECQDPIDYDDIDED